MTLREILSYAASRERFREQAQEQGWQLTRFAAPQAAGDSGEASIDVASRGPEDAPRTLVVTAGLHGVEGYFGSSLLLDWLQAAGATVAKSAASEVRMVAVHCLNPFGYVHRRRANEQNIDLNRNFMLAGERYSDAPAFDAELDALMHPREGSSRGDFFGLRLALMAVRRGGPKRVQQMIAGGQASNPQGLFFGGLAPSPFVAWCEQHWSRIVLPPGGASKDPGGSQGPGGRITHFDLHSGLGSFGTLKLLLQPGIDEAGVQWMQSRFGKGIVVPPPQADARPASTAGGKRGAATRGAAIRGRAATAADLPYAARGTWGRWLQHRFREARYRYACAEFGTYNALHVLAALRAENIAWHRFGAGSAEHERAADRLRDAFYPPSTRWRATVRAKFLALLSTAAHPAADDVLANKS